MEDLLDGLQQIDNLLARCVNPALTRPEHDAIRQTMNLIGQRIRLSYKLEQEKAEMEKASKEVEKGEA